MRGSWSRLPDEISERVLAWLPVPALCRCLSVCKKWNELIRQPRFHDLCDLNGRNRAHLFVTRHLSVDEHCQRVLGYDYQNSRRWRLETRCVLERTTRFLDLDERRWYSISADASRPADALRIQACDDSLVCEFSRLRAGYKLVMIDPIAKTSRELPLSTSDGKPLCNQFGDDDLPVMVTVVNKADRNFKVFLMNRICSVYGIPDHARLHFVYESATDAWRRLGTLPAQPLNRRGIMRYACIGESAVFFQGKLYVVFREDPRDCYSIILSYSPEDDLWTKVLEIEVQSATGFPQLIVSGNRMFMATWVVYYLRDTRHVDYFEISEIFVEENFGEVFEDEERFGGRSRSLVRIPYDDLDDVDGSRFGIAWGFPVDSSSVVLISRYTGKVLTYDLRSGRYTLRALPAHPLHILGGVSLERGRQGLSRPHFYAKLSNLSLRNILSVT